MVFRGLVLYISLCGGLCKRPAIYNQVLHGFPQAICAALPAARICIDLQLVHLGNPTGILLYFTER
jgi:hypothetical protein